MKIACIGDSLTDGSPGVSFFKILKKKYPNVTFVNISKAGETVKSLHTRLMKKEMEKDFDLAFLWIGVNDIYSRLLKVQAQPITRGSEEFKDFYESVLEIVKKAAKRVVVVSPAVIGETINSSNRGLLNLSIIIEEIAKQQKAVTFIDLQAKFMEELETRRSSDFLNIGVVQLVKDVFFYKSAKRIDKLSATRGLHLTMDGIHLNSRGANLVAEAYAEKIDDI
ncbi:SGNH/GDSL hydrolase family protein [Sutcliffiella rhizosphaerae]|uniref:GDSL family lipase n=1 Tax=Sutcliffiella rhizosphaerae TaxID=2880967 RepID=A0ABM8YR24_9BACI|nr:SGNH/GDSL hydrolase family protein [Sutcliffiella rhizosphaerae]CAG9622453.1 hypothetical protein BACCIP111883_03244 [Sutcliffiella rhizosphaerae]